MTTALSGWTPSHFIQSPLFPVKYAANKWGNQKVNCGFVVACVVGTEKSQFSHKVTVFPDLHTESPFGHNRSTNQFLRQVKTSKLLTPELFGEASVEFMKEVDFVQLTLWSKDDHDYTFLFHDSSRIWLVSLFRWDASRNLTQHEPPGAVTRLPATYKVRNTMQL